MAYDLKPLEWIKDLLRSDEENNARNRAASTAIPFDPAINAYPNDPNWNPQTADIIKNMGMLQQDPVTKEVGLSGIMSPDEKILAQPKKPFYDLIPFDNGVPVQEKPLDVPKKQKKSTPAPVARTEQPSSIPQKKDPIEEEVDLINSMTDEELAYPKEEKAPEASRLEKAMAAAREKENAINTLMAFDKIGKAIAGGGYIDTTPKGYEGLLKSARQEALDIEKLDEELRKQKEESRKEGQDKRDQERFIKEMEASGINLEKAKLGLTSEKDRRDPNSETSKLARLTTATLFNQMGQGGISKKIKEGNLSVQQIEDLYDQYNLSNMAAAWEAQQNRLQLADLKKQEKEEAREAKKEERIKTETKEIRDRVQKISDASGYGVSSANLKSIEDRFNSGKFTGVDDVLSIYSLIKAVDPGSVVRESEVELILGADSTLARAANLPAKITKGDLASPSLRQKVLDGLRNITKTREVQFKSQINPLLKQAEDSDIKFDRILPEGYSPKEQEKARDAISLTPAQQIGVKKFMDANGIADQNEAIQILKKAGKL